MTAWIDYLKAAYPAAAVKIADTTVAVYESQFAAVPAGRMIRVARAAVERSKWFPSVNELALIVRELDEAAEVAQAGIWPTYARIEQYRRLSASWPICPTCGEHTPDLAVCPFCADLAEMQRELIGDNQ